MFKGAVRLLLTIVVLCGWGAAAQTGEIEFELGFRSAVVENAWNPLRLVVRDLPTVEFELRVDQGTLRSGSIPLTYFARVDTSRGITVFEDELFIPPWSSLSWTVRTGARTVASGTIDPRLRDERPLSLLLSATPGRWLASLPAGARPQEVAAGELSERAAAYSGVAALIIDGSASAPTLESIVTAAAAGAVVVLVEPLPTSHAALLELLTASPGGYERLGAGWIVSTPAEGVSQALSGHSGFPLEESLRALLTGEERAAPPALSRLTVVAAAALYALVVVLLLRFGGDAGIPSALLVGIMTATASWLLLRPDRPVIEQPRTVVVSAGGLGLAVPTLALRSLPGGETLVGQQMRSAEVLPYSLQGDGTRLTLGRWQRELLVGQPELALGELAWSGERLTNLGERVLRDVIVLGLGPQPPLRPGTERRPVASEETSLPPIYGELLALLPAGTAVANDGQHFFVALPAGMEDTL
ncbi:MAG: hypothetical protein WD273_09590 [Trueperaceae bacterium]